MAHGFMNVRLVFVSKSPNTNNLQDGDYVVNGSMYRGVTPPNGSPECLPRNSADHGSSVTYAQGCERWDSPYDQLDFPEAIATTSAADVAAVVVGR